MTTIGKILYATDFSKRSLVALPLAVDLAKRYNAALHCVHVLDTEQDLFLEGGYMAPMVAGAAFDIAQLRQQAQTQLDQFVAEHVADLADSVKKVLLLGKPFVEIIHYARDEGIDLIVLGTHGRSALASMLLGSVTEKVVRKAPCAVLTVRHSEHRFEAP
ncbi:MAG: universal stress protein [Phycisphaerales bacterium]